MASRNSILEGNPVPTKQKSLAMPGLGGPGWWTLGLGGGDLPELLEVGRVVDEVEVGVGGQLHLVVVVIGTLGVDEDDPGAAGTEDVELLGRDEHAGDDQGDLGPAPIGRAQDPVAGEVDRRLVVHGPAQTDSAMGVDGAGLDHGPGEQHQAAVEVEGVDLLAEAFEGLAPALVDIGDGPGGAGVDDKEPQRRLLAWPCSSLMVLPPDSSAAMIR
jgi:hypothetical protein